MNLRIPQVEQDYLPMPRGTLKFIRYEMKYVSFVRQPTLAVSGPHAIPLVAHAANVLHFMSDKLEESSSVLVEFSHG